MEEEKKASSLQQAVETVKQKEEREAAAHKWVMALLEKETQEREKERK